MYDTEQFIGTFFGGSWDTRSSSPSVASSLRLDAIAIIVYERLGYVFFWFVSLLFGQFCGPRTRFSNLWRLWASGLVGRLFLKIMYRLVLSWRDTHQILIIYQVVVFYVIEVSVYFRRTAGKPLSDWLTSSRYFHVPGTHLGYWYVYFIIDI